MPILITHVILTYNDLSYLIETLSMSISASRLMQRNILIIDDGSEIPVEFTLKTIYDFKKNHISVIRHERNLGIVAGIKTAIKNVKTKYIHLGSSNDKIDEKFFLKHVNALEKFEDASFSFSDPGVFYEATGTRNNFNLNLSYIEKFFNPTEFINTYRKTPFHIGSNAILYKTNDLLLLDIRDDLGLYVDWYITYILAFKKGFVYIPEVLSYYCIHKNSYSKTQKREDNSDKIIKFFEYTYKTHIEVYNRMREACFISAFPLMDIIKILKNPFIEKCITQKALFICGLRQIWHLISKFLPISIRSIIRKRF